MGWRYQTDLSKQHVTEKDLKICDLCSTLNSKDNNECFTCGWQGAFCYDAQLIHLAWQRLHSEYQSVCMQHVTGSRNSVLTEYGIRHSQNPLQSLRGRLSQWWKGLHAARMAERTSASRRQHSQITY